MKINLNRFCNVILTEHGAEVYNEYFRELHATCQLIELTHLKAEDELSLQLWELMNIFGKYLYNGAESCFANNDISFNDKVVKIPERSREEVKELLANWKGTLVVGNDISPSPWISVEERLPDRHPAKFVNWSKEVFVAVKRGREYRAYVDKYSHIYKTWGGVFGDEVTHWMPIPELPKEE